MSEPCHDIPVFGCETCILSDRIRVLDAYQKTTRAPLCPECNGPTEAYDKCTKSMTISYVCMAGFTQDGEAICDGEVEVKVR